ncbi:MULTISPECIES: CsbD family protein [Streptomyces]|uniref:General stress protein CsbD n=2 Tax=Streptomyces TaxID=1883 RepID=A0A0W7WW75_9ACTN|nr:MULTISPECIES: CsbD family protein [Streptomyces]KUF14853.1 general stress protein CsbD [Streptomyces silvensis]MVO88688.1 CsbD family protein [Streptomyces typhae]
MAGNGGMDKAKGKAKEMAGKVTGNRERQVQGKVDQARGDAKKAMHDARERARKADPSLGRDKG